jgi:tRNA (guanine37-N1)-methyltransferase
MMGAEPMEHEQWAVRVPRSRGEEVRQQLLAEGVLDRGLKPRVEGEDLLLPVTGGGRERARFEARDQVTELPRHELIGGIAIMLEEDREAAEELLRLRPALHTVLLPVSEVEGEFRTRRFAVLAGRPTTATSYLEYGNRYEIDLSEAYFSARLSTERQRISSLSEGGERVFDMFAGVGPFAITLAPRASFVLATDINPGAVRLMEKNILINRARTVLPFLADAATVAEVIPWTFDRVIMNHPFGALSFLPQAFRFCRSGGTIHCYVLQTRAGQALPEIRKFPVRDIRERYVRSYSPGRWHAVYDIVAG